MPPEDDLIFETNNGGEVRFPDHDDRVFLSVWKNGAAVQVFFYEQSLEGEADSDRIHLLITPAGEQPRGWLMNVEDAIEIIAGLTRALRVAVRSGIPTSEKEDE